jgi:hypothetical protein
VLVPVGSIILAIVLIIASLFFASLQQELQGASFVIFFIIGIVTSSVGLILFFVYPNETKFCFKLRKKFKNQKRNYNESGR